MAILLYLDPLGMTVAAVSATLLLAAIVYVVRDQATALDASLTDAFTGSGFPLESDLFSTVLLEPRYTIGGHLISVVLHLIVILGTPLLPYLFPEELRFDSRKYSVKIMELRIPTPLFYTPAAEAPAKATVVRRASRAAASKTVKSAGRVRPRPAQVETSTTAVAVNRPRLELPTSVRSPSKDVIIQPDQPEHTIMALPPNLPTAFLWAQRPAPLDASRTVGMAPRPVPQVFSLPSSIPKVQKPNREVMISDLEIASAPVTTFRPPQLPVSPANVAAIRVITAPIELPGELPPTNMPGGNPVNLISLMRNPAPPATGYLLEPGNRLAEPRPGDAGAAGSVRIEEGASKIVESAFKDAAAAAAANNGAANGSSATGASGGANQNASDQGSGKTPAPATGSSSSSTTGSAPKPPPARPTNTEAAAANSAAPTATGAGNSDRRGNSSASGFSTPSGRMPIGGNLGVIVVQSSAQETALEGSEVLTGQPVFTVYFDVPGAPRRWILQYCVPGSQSKSLEATTESIIRILPKRSVQPPYPLDRIPLELKGSAGDVKRLVIYAFVNERGETENIRMIRGSGRDEIDGTALATLRRWAFRPATRGDTPVAVEALFGIPLE